MIGGTKWRKMWLQSVFCAWREQDEPVWKTSQTGLTHVFKLGSGDLELVQTLEKHSLTFLHHVVIRCFLERGRSTFLHYM